MVMAPSAITTINGEHTTSRFENDSRDGVTFGKTLTQEVLKRRVGDIDTDGCNPGDEDAFFVADMGEVYRQHLRWKMNLKRVKPHYGQSRL